jgi:hypothetical protein
MFTITLFFLNIFFGNYKTPKSRVLTLPSLFILGILAGWSQEALIVGVGAALIYIYIYIRYEITSGSAQSNGHYLWVSE